MKSKDEPSGQPFERVPVATLRQGRRGKHHEIVKKVLTELKATPDGTALQIPLADLQGISAPDFRSALARGAASEKLTISTYSDAEFFYVWLRSAGTKQYERKHTRDRAKRK